MKAYLKLNYERYFFLFLYAILLAIGLANHEFWMDESHHWLIARDSENPVALFENYRYDGHPMLWVLCLWVIACFTSNVIVVQIFHGIIAFGVAALFLFKAPFKKRYSLLFIFGYYPLFEYGILSRNYALTILFLLLFCVCYEKNKSLLLPFFLLGLASNSHLFGLIFSVLLVAKVLYDKKEALKNHLSAIGLFAFLLGIAVISIKAPSDHFFYFDFARMVNLGALGSVVSMWWKAICPIPDLMSPHFWNTNFITINYKILGVVFVLLSWILPLLLLKRKSNYYLVFYGYAALLMGFCLLTGLNISQRIGGFLYFGLVILIWLEQKEAKAHAVILPLNVKFKKIGIYLFLFIQTGSALALWIADVKRPFSNTQNIYNLVAENVEERTVVYAGLYCNYIGINNYGDLNLYISSQEQVKYCDWRTLKNNQGKVFWEEAIDLINLESYERVIVLRPKEVVDFDFPDYTIKLLGKFENALLKNENAYVYVVEKRP